MCFQAVLFLFAICWGCGFTKEASSNDYKPLQCNINAPVDINSDNCLSNNVVRFSKLYLPSSSTPLTIPCGKCVIMDYEDGSMVNIPGGLHVLGRLHFPSSANVVVKTTAVFVQGTWSMKIPDKGKSVKLVLYGNEEQFVYPHDLCCTDPNNFSYASCDVDCIYKRDLGKKPFAVVGGQLNIRAIDKKCLSWTTLKEVDILKNSLKVEANFARCLRPGDELLITSDNFSPNDASSFTVVSVDKGSNEVFLQEKMRRRLLPSEAGPGEPMFATEVALLRRDVIFEAESDPEDDLIGGHSIILETPNLTQIIEGVKFDNFGQAGFLGRYPIHFHRSGASPSLVSKNVVVNSNQRCVMIHGTDNVTVHDNVAYETSGNCYATEIGNERFNVFSNNLGASTRLLTRSNGQSDSPGLHTHQAATFWFRSVENTIVGNRAAGSDSIGFWIHMQHITDNALNLDSFKDNVAHSNAQGLLTYKKGWKPKNLAAIDNFKAYKNDEGFKFHITGNIKITNSVLADNRYDIRYGAWNSGVVVEDTTFIGLSQDAKLRFGRKCPYTMVGIRPSFNNGAKRQGQIVLKNVVFTKFTCSSKTIQFYKDWRLEKDTGEFDPVESTNVKITNSNESSKPAFECDDTYSNAFMEDFDGTLGPNGEGPGFIIRNNDRMNFFMPNLSCKTLPYDKDECSAFCKDVCLRMVHVKPHGRSGRNDFVGLVLTNQDTKKSQKYSINDDGKAAIVVPEGQYHIDFVDGDGNSLVADTVSVETFRTPRCGNYVSPSDFTFVTEAPSPSPSQSLTISAPPTYSAYYLFVGKDMNCPNDDRLSFQTSANTMKECYEQCYNEPICAYFSYNEESSVCLGCDPNSLPLLRTSGAAGFDSYRMEETQYARPAGSDMKCPFKKNARLFETNVSSLKECYKLCYDRPSCDYFSYDAKTTKCMGCNSNVLPLQAGPGFDAYELVASRNLPYEIMDLDTKCGDRLLKTKVSTRDGCYNLCRGTNGCYFFTFGEGYNLKSNLKNLCMLCKSKNSLRSHTGFNTYEMKSWKKSKSISSSRFLANMDLMSARLH